MEYGNDGSSEYPSSFMSSSEWDSDDSDGLSVDGYVTEEVGDDGNYDSWKCTGKIIQQTNYLITIPLTLLELVAVTLDSRPEVYFLMFFLEELVDTDVHGRRKCSSKSACPDNNHHAWIQVTLEEMKIFSSRCCKHDVKKYWSLNPSQASPLSEQCILEKGALTYCTVSNTLCWNVLNTNLKLFYILFNIFPNNIKGFICLGEREREICVDESIIGFHAEPQPPNIC